MSRRIILRKRFMKSVNIMIKCSHYGLLYVTFVYQQLIHNVLLNMWTNVLHGYINIYIYKNPQFIWKIALAFLDLEYEHCHLVATRTNPSKIHHDRVPNIESCFAYCQTKRLWILKDMYSHTVLPKEYFIQSSLLCFLKIRMFILHCVIKWLSRSHKVARRLTWAFHR